MQLPLIQGLIRDHYHIEAELGRGAFSKVYRATPSSAESISLMPPSITNVAIKVIDLNAYCAGFPRSVADRILALEVRILARLHAKLHDHAHLVCVFGIIAEPSGDRAAIVMEELRGGELFDRIASQRSFTERDAANLIRVVGDTLCQIHQVGILHRDLKPENLIYTTESPDARLCLVDFGLATIIGEPDPIAELGAMVGTLGYVAPEIVSSRTYSPACDVWSLGVLLYILLSGHMPFGGRSPSSILTNTMSQRYRFVPDVGWTNVSQPAKDLISSMLVVDTNKRASLQDVLNHPWITGFHTISQQVTKFMIPTSTTTTTTANTPSTPANMNHKNHQLIYGHHDLDGGGSSLQGSPPPAAAADLTTPNNNSAMVVLGDVITPSHDGRGTNERHPDFLVFMEEYKARGLARDVVLGARFGLKLRLLEVLGGVIPNFSLQQLQEMLSMFRKISGHNDRATLVEFYQVMSHSPVPLPLDNVFRLFDRAGQGTFSYVALLCHLASMPQIDNNVLEFCFRAHDTSGVGTLKRSQIGHLLRNLLSGRLTSAEGGAVTMASPLLQPTSINVHKENNWNNSLPPPPPPPTNHHPTNHNTSSTFHREDSMMMNGMSMAFASFCVVDDNAVHLEDRLYELFGTMGSGSIGFDTFQRLFANEPSVHKALLSPVVLTAASTSHHHGGSPIITHHHHHIPALITTTTTTATPGGVVAAVPIASMQFGMTMEEFVKAETGKLNMRGSTTSLNSQGDVEMTLDGGTNTNNNSNTNNNNGNGDISGSINNSNNNNTDGQCIIA
jgi:serine/threonine protein kinase